MKKTISITFEIEDSNNLKQDLYATIYYPDEGNKIILRKGMNVIELSETIHHEIGHLIDWYLSKGNSRDHVDVREDNAVTIGEGIRFKGELNWNIELWYDCNEYSTSIIDPGRSDYARKVVAHIATRDMLNSMKNVSLGREDPEEVQHHY